MGKRKAPHSVGIPDEAAANALELGKRSLAAWDALAAADEDLSIWAASLLRIVNQEEIAVIAARFRAMADDGRLDGADRQQARRRQKAIMKVSRGTKEPL